MQKILTNVYCVVDGYKLETDRLSKNIRTEKSTHDHIHRYMLHKVLKKIPDTFNDEGGQQQNQAGYGVTQYHNTARVHTRLYTDVSIGCCAWLEEINAL